MATATDDCECEKLLKSIDKSMGEFLKVQKEQEIEYAKMRKIFIKMGEFLSIKIKAKVKDI